MVYDNNNPFAKILRKELPCKYVYEDEYVVAFWSIDPKAPVHILVIPKGSYVNYRHFIQAAPEGEILGFQRGIIKTAEKMQLHNGYRIVSNIGEDSGQSVFHMHMHILGKAKLQDDIDL